ncbi:MAG: ribonuclease J [Alphaproteobacteria bacterium]|nr:ribonuclease J [Alphaproteobacteria bacterium]
MNLNLYGYAGKWLMVDLGVTFGDDSVPGIDVVMPDPGFIVERKADLIGLVLTHAHEDHLGAVHHLWRRLRCPVYATPFTASVLRRKLAEAGLEREVRITEIPMSGRFELAPFQIELITLTHSIPEPNALVIRTPAGTVLHTGDWKFDPDPLIGPTADEAALRRVGQEGVLALIGDSTNVFRPGEAGSEAAVRASLIELVAKHRQGVAIACFASNVARLESAAVAAQANGRQAALVGRSLWRMNEAARENGYLRDTPPFLSEERAAGLPPEDVLLICTGSQGEPRAALSRIAQGNHPNIALEDGGAVIFSSRIIPGNEKAIGRLQDQLTRLGVEVITEQTEFVHVSGHPARDELARMYSHVRPHVAVPVHGEMRHLVEHAKLARDCQVPVSVVVENGAVVRLAPGEPAIIDKVPVGRLGLDGSRLVPLDGTVMRDRQRLVHGGAATATLVLDRAGKLLAEPVVSAPGILDPEGDDAVGAAMREALRSAVDQMPPGARRDDGAVREVARSALRRVFKADLGRRPLTDIHLVRV